MESVCPEMSRGRQLKAGLALLPLWPFALLGWEGGSGRTGHLPLAPGHWGLETASCVGVDMADLAPSLTHRSACHFHLGCRWG